MEQVRNEQTIYSAAVYCRLSKDDDQAGESVSIETQKMNILTRKTYSLSTGTLLSTDSWGYGDSTFGDRLTAYNGETVSYDAYGRVSQYRGEHVGYYWDTNFERIYNIGSVYFTYHEDGMRRTKSVGNLTHSYTYDGINLVREEWGDNTLIFLYDASGSPVGMQYRNSSYASGAWDVYFYEKNLQGDIVSVYTEDRTLLVSYTYDAWGSFTATYHNGGALTSAAYNPFTYRGYYYDTETGLYYVSSRYYDPEIGRWINADGFVSTGQDITGYNMFAYCGNNPVNRKDPTGQFWITALIVTAVVAVCTVTLSGCSSQSAPSSPRSDLANAPDLDVSTASPGSYNCYGNGIGKQICADPTGYIRGDSTRETFEAVKNDLGSNNVRELTSISDPIGDDEFKVALKCGPMDYHFIRLDSNGWYNKSGNAPGLYIDQSVVAEDIWYAMWMNNGQAYVGNPKYGFPFYNDETIYFAVKVEWDVQ